jgi:NitT/TauT family transport system permease protein
MIKNRWKSFFTLIIITLVWELACKTGWLETAILPPPRDVIVTLIRLIGSGELLQDAAISLWRVFVGFVLASVFGISLGVMTGLSQHFKEYTAPVLELLRPIPPVAFVPISVLWFGIGNGPAYFLVTFGAFFPIFTNALAGILSMNPIHRDAALCLGASKRLMLTDVILPASMPYLVAGLKTGLGTAWFCVIVAELVGAQSGLGYMIQLNRLTLQSEKVIAGMVAIGVLGYGMNRFMVYIHRRLVPWRIDSL